jgi:adenine deaminase
MPSSTFTLEANIVDVLNRKIGFGHILVENGLISEMIITGETKENFHFVLPGFIDAHIHIESSMLTPPAFAKKSSDTWNSLHDF